MNEVKAAFLEWKKTNPKGTEMDFATEYAGENFDKLVKNMTLKKAKK